MIKNPKEKIFIIPDSPTGADIVDDGQFEDICNTGTGSFTLRGSIEVDEMNNTLTITSIPLQTTIDEIIRKIVELREKKIFDEIKDIKDYSNDKEVRTVIYLDQSANPYNTIEKLYSKDTGLKNTYPVGLRMIDDYVDYDYSITSFLKEWIEYRRDVVRSSFNTRLVKAMENQNINDILLFVLNEDNAEETIKMAKHSSNKQEFAEKLMKKFHIDSQQANSIASMRIYAFNKDAYEGYKKRKIELKKEIEELSKILDDDSKIDETIIEQLEEGIKLFGCPRKSKIVKDTKEEEVKDTDHIVAVSTDGYIKKVPLDLKQIGQVGNSNGQYMTLRINNKESILVFDSTGTVSKVPISVIPDMNLDDNGIVLERYFSVHGNIVSILIEPSKNDLKKKGKDLFLTFLTKQGFVKKTLLSEFSHINGSISAIKLPNNDELVAVEYTFDNTCKDMVIYTNRGNGIRRDINEFSVMKANARGVRQISMAEDEFCVGFNKINPDKKYMFYITTAGRIKITDMKYFPTMKRKDDVISLINLENNESLVGIRTVSKDDKVVVYKKNSQPDIIYIKDLPVSTRVAKAEKLIKTPKGERVLSFTVVSAN